MSLVSILSFFSSEFVSRYSKEYNEAYKEYKQAIDSVTLALDNVKKEAKGTLAMAKYEEVKAVKNVKKSRFYKVKKDTKFLEFNDFWQFSYEFGKIFCWLCLVIFLLIWFVKKGSNNLGMLFLLCSYLSIAVSKIYWIFQPFRDLSRLTYYLIAILTSLLICRGIYLIAKYRKNSIDRLKDANKKLEDIREKLIVHTILHSDPEKKKEILDYIEATYQIPDK